MSVGWGLGAGVRSSDGPWTTSQSAGVSSLDEGSDFFFSCSGKSGIKYGEMTLEEPVDDIERTPEDVVAEAAARAILDDDAIRMALAVLVRENMAGSVFHFAFQVV